MNNFFRPPATGKQNWLVRLAVLGVLVSGLAASSVSAGERDTAVSSEAAWAAGWPQAPGPEYDWAALDTGVALVDDLGKGRIVWESESLMPRAKAYNAIDRRMPSHGLPTGGGYGPILADGRLYQWHYLPSGETATVVTEGRARPYTRNVTLAADLHLVAVDPADGRTLWRRVLPGVTPNFQGGKSVTPQNLSPCAAGGRVFALGRDGRVYAFRGDDGELIWEHVLPRPFAEAMADRSNDLLSRMRFDAHDHGDGDAPLVCLGDRVFINVKGDRLHALDAATGAPAWELADGLAGFFYPIPWPGKDGLRLLVSGASGIHCLDAKTGKALWLHKGIDAQSRLFRHGDRLIVLAERRVHGIDNDGRIGHLTNGGNAYNKGTPACYRLSDTGLERLWGTSDQFKGTVESAVIAVAGKLAAVRGDALLLATPRTVDVGPLKDPEAKSTSPSALQPGETKHVVAGDDKPADLLVLDLATGAVRWRGAVAGSQAEFFFQRMGDRLWADNDCGHESQQNSWVDIGANPPKSLNPAWRPPWAVTVPYSNYLNKDLVDGRMFIRTAFGLLCYDLRADPKSGFTPAPQSPPKWAEALPEALRGLASPRLRERGAAAAKLINDPGAAAGHAADLARMMSEGDYNTRRAARQVFEAAGPKAAAAGPALSDTLARLAAAGSGDSAFQASRALAAVDGTRAAGLVAALAKQATGKGDFPVRRAAILALAGLPRGNAGQARKALVALLEDADPAIAVVSARALGRLADGDAAALTALGGRLKSEELSVAYACAEAIRTVSARNGVPAEVAARIVVHLGDIAPGRGQTAMPVLLAADKLGEPGRGLMLRLVAAAAEGKKGGEYRALLLPSLGALLAAGVPANDATLQKLVAADSHFGARLQMYADPKYARRPEKGDGLPEAYGKFWSNIDADAAASAVGDEVW